MMALRPRTIRGQLIAALVVFELLTLAVFAVLLVREQNAELGSRISRRLEFQASQFALQVAAAAANGKTPGGNQAALQEIASSMARFPSIHAVQVTDMQGRTVVSSDPSMNGELNLSSLESGYLTGLRGPTIFSLSTDAHEVVAPVTVNGRTAALVWIYPNEDEDKLQMRSLMRLSLTSAGLVILGCTLLANLLSRSITRPLRRLMVATRQIVRDPEDMKGFPLEVHGVNEASDLTRAFNLMVTSLEEQRAGLNDTLALLDSMLANAPIGLVFFDRRLRFVRVNQFLAEMTQMNINRSLGRTLHEALPPEAAAGLRPSLESVFATGQAVREIELRGNLAWNAKQPQTWLVSVYPVRSGTTHEVRWAGAIVVDATERRHSEEALRKTEKLAAAGRLAASIAHEINNPLEAVTNLLYLLRHHSSLSEEAAAYTEQAQHEVARVSEITQQTLRFYRQSTLAARANVCELLESVLTLHHGRVISLHVEVARRYREPVELFCFSGEMRQLFANLIGNALDAMMPGGGTLSIRLRPGQLWSGHMKVSGVRMVVADSGCGMTDEIKKRIFEPFYTTKEATGTGLGLWVSAEIISKHRGTVRIRSRVASSDGGKQSGTVFMLFFPDPVSASVVMTGAAAVSVGV